MPTGVGGHEGLAHVVSCLIVRSHKDEQLLCVPVKQVREVCSSQGLCCYWQYVTGNMQRNARRNADTVKHNAGYWLLDQT